MSLLHHQNDPIDDVREAYELLKGEKIRDFFDAEFGKSLEEIKKKWKNRVDIAPTPERREQLPWAFA